jgi:hypothetical protein
VSFVKIIITCVLSSVCFLHCASVSLKGRLTIAEDIAAKAAETGIKSNTRRSNFSKAMAVMRINSPSFESVQDDPFLLVIADIADDPSVRHMSSFNHHKDSTLSHSITVARVSYYLAKALKLDAVSTARGAILHDFFLYDWNDGIRRRHRTTHPFTALGNAEERFTLNPVEKDIILTHMWPVAKPFYSFRESFLVSSVDKLVSMNSIGMILRSKFRRRSLQNKVAVKD